MIRSRYTSLAVLLALHGAATAQTPSFNLHGFGGNKSFGHDICVVGDQDGDGVDDFVVADPSYTGPTQLFHAKKDGAIHLFSGATGAHLLDAWVETEVSGPGSETWAFGASVANVGDWNGDGRDDVAVGAPLYSTGPSLGIGVVIIMSLDPSSTNYHKFSVVKFLTGDTNFGGFGSQVASAGDVNNDGAPDLMVAMTYPRRVRTYSGADEQLLYDLGTGSNFDKFGWSMAGVGDYDSDGCDDFAVGAPGMIGDRGRLTVYSGKTGAELLQVNGVNVGDHLGSSVANAGDANGDGVCDIAVGAPGSDVGSNNGGRVILCAGGTGTLLQATTGNWGHRLGEEIAGVGDVDLDGHGDIAICAYNGTIQKGYVRVFSGGTGFIIEDLQANQSFGKVVAGGDIDGDQRGDVLLGVPGDVPIGSGSTGSVTAYSATVIGYPGTGEDVELKSGTGVGYTWVDDVWTINAGQWLWYEVVSPLQTQYGAPAIVLAQPFLTGTPAPRDASNPAIHLDFTLAPAPFVLINNTSLPLLSSFGQIPAGAEGVSLMLQGFAITSQAKNTTFMATDAQEIQIK